MAQKVSSMEMSPMGSQNWLKGVKNSRRQMSSRRQAGLRTDLFHNDLWPRSAQPAVKIHVRYPESNETWLPASKRISRRATLAGAHRANFVYPGLVEKRRAASPCPRRAEKGRGSQRAVQGGFLLPTRRNPGSKFRATTLLRQQPKSCDSNHRALEHGYRSVSPTPCVVTDMKAGQQMVLIHCSVQDFSLSMIAAHTSSWPSPEKLMVISAYFVYSATRSSKRSAKDWSGRLARPRVE